MFDELVLSLLLVIECVGEDAADEFKVFCEHAEYDCCDSFGEIDEVEDVEEEDEDICEGDCDICWWCCCCCCSCCCWVCSLYFCAISLILLLLYKLDVVVRLPLCTGIVVVAVLFVFAKGIDAAKVDTIEFGCWWWWWWWLNIVELEAIEAGFDIVWLLWLYNKW